MQRLLSDVGTCSSSHSPFRCSLQTTWLRRTPGRLCLQQPRLVVTCSRPPSSSRGGQGGGSRGGGRGGSRGGSTTGSRGGGSGSRGGGGFRGGSRGGGSSSAYRPPPRPPQQQQVPAGPGQGGQQGGQQGGNGYSGRGGGNRYSARAKGGPLDIPINEEIDADTVRVLGEEKEMLGVMSLVEALQRADDADVDVVLISADADPPVVRLVDFSKFKFEAAKAAKEASKKQRETRQELKELKFRPSTDVHDYQVRLRAAQKFIAKGDRVKLTLTFKGREMQFQEIGKDLFKKFVEDVGDEAMVTQAPRMAGNQMTLLLAPNTKEKAVTK